MQNCNSMKKGVLTILAILTLLSCEEAEKVSVGPLAGTYEGIFFRTSPGAKYETSDVTLSFEGNAFEGSSNIAKYPAICHGTFTLTVNEIDFNNLCVWTAEFDWSYILSGNFNITRNGDEIIMTRNYDNGAVDTYRIKPSSNVG